MIADDHRILRQSLKSFLEAKGLEVVSQASNAKEALALAGKIRPQIIFLDIEMPGGGGIATIRKIARLSPSSQVLMLSAHDDEQYVRDALTKAGAIGYLVKRDLIQDMDRAVRAAMIGKRYVSSSVACITRGSVKIACELHGIEVITRRTPNAATNRARSNYRRD